MSCIIIVIYIIQYHEAESPWNIDDGLLLVVCNIGYFPITIIAYHKLSAEITTIIEM